MVKAIQKLDEELAELSALCPGLKVCTEQALLVGAAYEGHPTQEKALVFVFKGQDYLVPVTNSWDGLRLTESVVRLDLAERVISRPHASSRIGDMLRSKKIAPEARLALLNGIRSWFLPESGYSVRIVGNEAPPLAEHAADETA